jgi:hypothetical protein
MNVGSAHEISTVAVSTTATTGSGIGVVLMVGPLVVGCLLVVEMNAENAIVRGGVSAEGKTCAVIAVVVLALEVPVVFDRSVVRGDEVLFTFIENVVLGDEVLFVFVGNVVLDDDATTVDKLSPLVLVITLPGVSVRTRAVGVVAVLAFEVLVTFEPMDRGVVAGACDSTTTVVFVALVVVVDAFILFVVVSVCMVVVAFDTRVLAVVFVADGAVVVGDALDEVGALIVVCITLVDVVSFTVHTLAPVDVASVPAEHGTHTVAPVAPEYVPIPHAVGFIFLKPLQYDPAGHAVGFVFLRPRQYDPAGHGVGFTFPVPLQYVPSGHAVGTEAPTLLQ